MPELPEYLVRDAQGNLYGPADMNTLRTWVAQERIGPGMFIAPRGSDAWIEVTQHPDLAPLLPAPASTDTVALEARPGGDNSTDPIDDFKNPIPTLTYGTPLPQNQLALWSMIIGIAAIPSMCVCGILPLGLGITAIVLGVMGLKRIKENPARPGRGQAIAGIVLGIIALFLTALLVVFVIIAIRNGPP